MIFTKFDSLDAEAYRHLCDQGVAPEEAERRAPELADAEFEQTYSSLIENRTYAPAAGVCLRSESHSHVVCI